MLKSKKIAALSFLVILFTIGLANISFSLAIGNLSVEGDSSGQNGRFFNNSLFSQSEREKKLNDPDNPEPKSMISSFPSTIENLENIEDEQQKNYIDITQMRVKLIKQLDSNDNLISDKLEDQINQKTGNEDELVSLIVNTESIDIEEELSLFEELGGVIGHVWDELDDIIYGFSGKMEVSKVKEFSTQVGSELRLIEENLPAIRNSDKSTHLAMVRTYVWDTLNYTGDPNMSIAVLDTGIDDTHQAFFPGYEDQNWTKKIVGWYDATNDASATPDDYVGHGSHVAGIIAANEYNNTYDDGRIVSTWSYSYDAEGSASRTYSYILWVNKTGTIDISYVWQGEDSALGTALYLYASNGTMTASNTSGNSNMTVSSEITSESDFGYWRVALGVSWGATGGMLDVVGVNKYPYPESNDDYSRFAGVAPDTKLVGVKIFNKTGDGKAADVVEAFNWVKNNRETYHIAIASGSFSFFETVDTVDSAAAALVNSGILVILSAGNDGQGRNSIYSPGQVDGVITVAASDDYDKITTYSSEGPGEISNTSKPDITAPGGESTQGGILQVDSNDADSKTNTWNDKYLDDFTNIQGTSMACPFVSGSLALLIQAMGGYDFWENGYGSATYPFKAKQLILMTANEIYLDNRGEKDIVEGYGRLNIYAAIEAIENTYEVNTQVNSYLSSELGKRKVWAQNVALTAGVNYSLELKVPWGADFDLFLYESNPNQFGEPRIALKSTNFEPGADEYLTYTPQVSGSYYLVVKTSFTNRGSGVFNLTSTYGNGYPVISLISPIDHDKLKGQITIQIEASDSDLSAVYFKTAADTWITTTVSGPYYEYIYNTTALPDDNYTFIAKGVDNEGQISYSTAVRVYTDNFEESILLVDDDEGENYEIYYERALSKLLLHRGISYDYYNVQTSGSPSADTLKKYELVIWFTSIDRDTTLSPTDQNNLKSYLDQGGYLLISGQDIGFDINSFSFYGDYLHAEYQGDSVTDNRYLTGESSDIFEGKRYYLGSGAGSGHNEYPSDIDAGTNATLILNYFGNSNYGAGIKYSGVHKVIYFSFNWEAIDDENERIDCLNLSLNWFKLDQTPSSVSISTPSTGSTTKENVFFSWSGIDDIGIERYVIFRDGVHIKTTTETNAILSNQPDGWHSYRIVAVDVKNHSVAGMVSIYVDLTPPMIKIDSPSELSYISTILTVTLSGDAVNYWYYIEPVDDLNDTWTASVEREISDGIYFLHAYGNDSVGNIQHVSITFTIDTNPLIVTIESPTNTIYAKNSVNVSLSGNADNYWYYIETIDEFNISWKMNGNRELSDGTYTLHAYGNDSMGYEIHTASMFTIDTTPPEVNIISPISQVYFNGTVKISLTGDAHHYWYYIEGVDIENHTWSDDITRIITNGSYTIHVYCNDSIGNEAHVFVVFGVIIDLFPPEIFLHSTQNGSILNAGTEIYFNVTDSDLDTVSYNWNNLQNNTMTSPYSVVLPENVGNHTLYIFANDSTGNWVSIQFVFIIEELIDTTSEPMSTDGTSSSNEYTSTNEKTSTTETLIATTSNQELEEITSGFFLLASITFLTTISILRRKYNRR